MEIRSCHVSDDSETLFLEIPDLQPVNQVHLYLQTAPGQWNELFVTVHRLDAPFTDWPDYRPVVKDVWPHPIHADVLLATQAVPNPWRQQIDGARQIRLGCQRNLTFDQSTIRVRAGEPIRLTLDSFSIDFHAPQEPGRYPYLCTFPGHGSVMQGEMIVASGED